MLIEELNACGHAPGGFTATGGGALQGKQGPSKQGERGARGHRGPPGAAMRGVDAVLRSGKIGLLWEDGTMSDVRRAHEQGNVLGLGFHAR
jgi:hypothetical protein